MLASLASLVVRMFLLVAATYSHKMILTEEVVFDKIMAVRINIGFTREEKIDTKMTFKT